MSLTEIEALVGVILAILGSIVGMYKYFNSRISRVYERFDVYKTLIESKFVYREMCAVLHENNSSNFSKLERRMELGFQSVDEKLNELQKIVLHEIKSDNGNGGKR